MAGLFDDLIPATTSGSGATPAVAAAGLFDDLIPKQAAAPAQKPATAASAQSDEDLDPLGSIEPSAHENGQYEPLSNVPKKADDAVRMIADGASLGFADRIAAGVEALAGKGSYSDNLAAERARDAQIRAENPAEAAVESGAGSLATPIGAAGRVAEGANLGTKIVRGMATGAGIGGVQAASQVEDLAHPTAQDVGHVGEGAGYGLLAGAAIPTFAAGVGSAYHTLSNAANGSVDGLGSPARQYLINALMGDDPQKVISNLETLGPRAMPLDAGPNLEGIGMGLYPKPGPARAVVGGALTGRNDTANATVQDALDQSMGPATSPLVATQDLRAQRAAVHNQLPSIFAGAPEVDTSDVLSNIGSGLTKAVGPERTVLTKARDFLMKDGPVNPDDAADLQALKEQLNGASPSETATIKEQIGDLQNQIAQRSKVPVKDAETLNNAKMAIDKLIDYGDPGLGVQPGAVSKSQGAIGVVRKQLNGALRDQVPGYADAMDQSSSFARQIEQIEEGTKALKDTSTWPSDYGVTFGSLSPEEQAAHRLGMRSNFETAVTNKENDLQATKGLMQGANGEGGNAQKVAIAFGQPASDHISSTVNAEQAFRNVKGRIVDGSMTAPRQMMAKSLADAPFDPWTVNLGDLRSLTLAGSVAAPAQAGVNYLLRALQRPVDNTSRDLQLARAVTSQGDDAKELIRQLMSASGNRAANMSAADRLAYATTLLGGAGAGAVNAYERRPAYP